jgi:peptide/nickel transport system substrate-binding protein
MLQAGSVAGFAVLFTSACSSNDGQQSGSSSTALTIGQPFAPDTLDPAKASVGVSMYAWPAYDPLIYLTPDGSLKPRLAISWRYIGSGNKLFEMKLRSGVTFSDGSPLTAAVMKKNVEYAKQAGGQMAPQLALITSVDVIDDLTVQMKTSAPFPLMPYLFTQIMQPGLMISGKALDQPKKLAARTFGAGPYILEPADTVPSDHYTFTRNPRYWDKSSVPYRKMVVKVLPNPNTALAALKTGQVDAITGDPTTVKAVTAAGLHVTSAPVSFWGLAFADRAGHLVPALGDTRVRQAINYAIDRKKIATALLGRYGAPAQQIVASGMDGYNDTTFYTYDPAKAKHLLTEAGYGNGFTIPTLSITLLNQMAQAIADNLEHVGIRLQITNRTDAPIYTKDLASGKFPAFAIGYGMNPIAIMGKGLFLPDAGLFNPRKSSDPQINAWYRRAMAADDTTRAELDKKIVARLAEQAWFAPVMYAPQLVYSRSTVSGIQVTARRPSPYPLEWKPEK